ncbi:MAG: hypothetical protein JSV22_05500, partial [Bacteroidales bacterium]
DIELDIYPALEYVPEASHGKLESLTGESNLFSRYNLIMPDIKIKQEVNQVTNNKLLITIPSEMPERLNDVFLRINYLGDTGMGFINNELVADNFYYGSDWEIGFKRFMDQPDSKEMLFYFRPLYKDAPFYEDFAPELIPDFSQSGRIFKINNTQFIPEYKAVVQFE